VISGIGTDLIRVDRMKKLVARGKAYLETIFTEKEILYCESKTRKAEHYAARYAGKEALLKALGCGWRDGIAFSEIEIHNDELGRPQISLQGKARSVFEGQHIQQASISLSHIDEIALAIVILEK
jgi:holo-[acyl-carrier protein] synthase